MLSPIDSLFHNSSFSDFLFNNVDEAMCLIDSNLHVLRVNEALKKIFNVNAAQEGIPFGSVARCKYAAQTDKICGSTESCSGCTVYTCVEEAIKNKKEIRRMSLPWEFTGDGRKNVKYLEFTYIPMSFCNLTYVLVIIHDESMLEKQEQHIKELCDRDFLTGLADRQYFYDVFESYFRTAKRGFINLAVCLIAVDSLQTVNDIYGHRAGDFVLKELSSVLKKNLRQADFFARYGGDKFGLFFQYRKKTDVFFAAEKLRSLVETHEFIYKEKKLRVTISIGVTIQPGHSTDIVIAKADKLLRTAREKGGNKIEIDG
ncbi:MAG: GGDEF domain-containing protein [Treponema sp.]|nr:GGDEF domain-containing protein [Treponema sp.]